MAVELATAYVNLVPSAKGFVEAVQQQVSAPIQKAARDASAIMEQVGTAGDRVAAQVAADGQRIAAAFAAQKSAAAALAAEMGPGLVAAYAASGQSTLDLVAKLKTSELSFKDVEQSAGAFAQSLRSLQESGVTLQGTAVQADKLGTSVQQVGTKADRTRSAMGQFGGDAVRELGAAVGATGPLNSALSQVATNAALGGVSLKTIAISAGAVAAVSFVTGQIAADNKKIAEIKTWKTDQINGYTEAVKRGDNAVKALTDRLVAAGKVEFSPASFAKFDITPVLSKNGIGVQQFSQAVGGGKEGLVKLAAAMQAAGISTSDQGVILSAATQQQELYNDGVKKGADFLKVYGDAQAQAARQAFEAQVASDSQTTQAAALVDGYTAAWKRTHPVIDQTTSRVEHLRERTEAIKQAAEDAAGGYDFMRDTIAKSNQAADIDQGFKDLEKAAKDAFDAAKNHAKDAGVKMDEFKQKQRDQISLLLDYEQDVLKLPASQAVRINTLIDKGEIAEAEQELRILTRDRQMQVTFAFKNGGDTYNTGARDTKGNLPQRAAGGPVEPGRMYEVLEKGRSELLTVGDRTVLMAGQHGYVTPMSTVPELKNTEAKWPDGQPIRLRVGEREFDAYLEYSHGRHDALEAGKMMAGRS